MTFHPVSFSRLAQLYLLTVGIVLAAACPAAAETNRTAPTRLTTTGIRTSGPLSVSLQNEVNEAIDRGRSWLLAQQNVDGSWGSNNCTRLSALATLALAHDASPEQKRAVEKGAHWLLSPAATNPSCAFAPDTMAWRELTLQAVVPANAERTTDFLRQLSARSTTNGFHPLALMLIREAAAPQEFPYPWTQNDSNTVSRLYTACLLCMPPGGNRPSSSANEILMQLASQWSSRAMLAYDMASITRPCWVLSHFINRAGGGTLADAQGRIVDWRNDLAKELVSSQTTAPQGTGGYWKSPAAFAPLDPVENTAFALLALDEL